MTLEMLTTFFGWCVVINGGILLLTSVCLVPLRRTVAKIHGAMFGLSEEQVSGYYFDYLANFKIAFLVFSFAPYVALKLMG